MRDVSSDQVPSKVDVARRGGGSAADGPVAATPGEVAKTATSASIGAFHESFIPTTSIQGRNSVYAWLGYVRVGSEADNHYSTSCDSVVRRIAWPDANPLAKKLQEARELSRLSEASFRKD